MPYWYVKTDEDNIRVCIGTTPRVAAKSSFGVITSNMRFALIGDKPPNKISTEKRRLALKNWLTLEELEKQTDAS